MKRVALFMALSMSLAGSAIAQSKKSPTSSPSKTPTLKIDIEEENVNGDTPKSGAEIISTPPRPKQNKLIKIRDNFTVEMIKSIYEL